MNQDTRLDNRIIDLRVRMGIRIGMSVRLWKRELGNGYQNRNECQDREEGLGEWVPG